MNVKKLTACALCAITCCALATLASAQSGQPTTPQSTAQQVTQPQEKSGIGQKSTGNPAPSKSGGDSNSESKPASAGETAKGEAAASTTLLKLGPLDPAVAPTDIPHDRPVIGLALGGGGALAMSEIGALEWLEEHHIPVDVIAGTSMGSILAALYSTGHTPEEMRHIMTEDSVNNVFRITQAYTKESYRRREDAQNVPNAITIGLKHGVSFRNAILTDTGLNDLLDKEFLRYNDQTDFNNLPIPFRCQATDLNDAKTVTFSRGSLQDAVRASASLPGVFRPFQLDGHEFVDGAVLDNLPTGDVKAMKADVILAVSMPLEPVAKGDLDSILGVLQRAFAVAIEDNEARNRKLANVVLMPDIKGFGSSDYLKTAALAKRGYEAAEANKAALLPYAVTDEQWATYIARRKSKERGPAGSIQMVKISAPNPSVKEAVSRKFQPLVNQPVDNDQIESLLADIRGDGRYDAGYTVGYDTTTSTSANSEAARRPIVLVTVSDKKTGPPFLDLGVNIAAQTGGVTRATVNTILHYQDLGNYGSELRANIDVGFYTRLQTEYYRRLSWSGFFAAPRLNLDRTPYYIYSGHTRLSERQSQFAGGGGDLGWSDGRLQELRVGWQYQNVQWTTTTGNDGLPDFHGGSQNARIRYVYDNQDRALVPEYGIRLTTDFGYLYGTPGSPSAPKLYTQLQLAHTISRKNTFLFNAEGGTLFNTAVAQPFRFTLGGPLRLAASSVDQYRGTDYFLVTPGYLRKIHSLPAPLGNSLYFGATYEAGQMRSPDGRTITRQDAYFGIIAETPLGVISVAPAIGDGGERKLVFTIGKLF